MLRIVVHALAVLHLGPGIAFALLAFGCDASEPLLGSMCTGSPLRFFIVLTLVSWAVLGAASAVLIRSQGARLRATT